MLHNGSEVSELVFKAGSVELQNLQTFYCTPRNTIVKATKHNQETPTRLPQSSAKLHICLSVRDLGKPFFTPHCRGQGGPLAEGSVVGSPAWSQGIGSCQGMRVGLSNCNNTNYCLLNICSMPGPFQSSADGGCQAGLRSGC